MYSIKKSKAPNSLVEYKKQYDATYGNLPGDVKSKIQDYLLKEQGHVCAYCMARIKKETMRIEHWASQACNDHLQLDYENMLGCCHGNEKEGRDRYICDKKKGNSALKYSPAIEKHKINSRIYFQGNGKICSEDDGFNKQLATVLNLNETRLLKNRVKALEFIHSRLSNKQGTRTKQQIETEYNKVLSLNAKHMYTPYFGMLANYLKDKM